jgi:diadenosine tetraphosphatase ApaH/serine/threonine PP2A family protein phosphatase
MAALLTYAIGDIHGCYTQLRNLLGHCRQHCGSNPSRFIFVGDYIDRGRHSREVVDFLIETQASAPERFVCLRGNHDDMAVNAALGQDVEIWLANGGGATLRSYGVGRADEMVRAHLDWLDSLPLCMSDARRFYVHAGIMPGVPLERQSKDVMLWIREPFLSDPRDHGRFIVHGHTPVESPVPELRANRLDLDTGACFGGPLSAAVFDEGAAGPLAFISDDGTILEAPANIEGH